MKTVRSLPLLFVLLFVISCKNSSTDSAETNKSTETEDSTSVSELELNFSQLFSYLKSQDSSFAPDRFDEEVVQMNSIPRLAIDSAQLAPYLPYLLFNSDSSFAIDPVSYTYVVKQRGNESVLVEGGPDTEIGVIDFKAKKRSQISSAGPMVSFLDAVWLDRNTALYALAIDEGSGGIRIDIWKYHTNTPNERERYGYRGTISADISNYGIKRLNEKTAHNELRAYSINQ